VNRWLQTEPAVKNTQLYKNREGRRESRPHGKSIEKRGVGSVEKARRAGSRGGLEPVEDCCIKGK
jgi:hypothetical protein